MTIAGTVKATMVKDDDENGLGFAFEKLTHGYWRNYIRTTVLNTKGERTHSELGCLLQKNLLFGGGATAFPLAVSLPFCYFVKILH